MTQQKDVIIQLFEKKRDALDLLGKAWEILYFEGNSPDVGKRRENFIIEMLREEFGLNVEQAPDTEKEIDFKIQIGNRWKKYSLKTMELKPRETKRGKRYDYSNVKMAWDGFPDKKNAVKKILTFNFDYDLLLVIGNREEHTISMAIIRSSDLKKIQAECKTDPDKVDKYWWIPNANTNPRGFGLRGKTIKALLENAKSRGDFITYTYKPLPKDKIEKLKRQYFKDWYALIKKIASSAKSTDE